MPPAAQIPHVFNVFPDITILEVFALLVHVPLVTASSASQVLYAISALQSTNCPRMQLLVCLQDVLSLTVMPVPILPPAQNVWPIINLLVMAVFCSVQYRIASHALPHQIALPALSTIKLPCLEPFVCLAAIFPIVTYVPPSLHA